MKCLHFWLTNVNDERSERLWSITCEQPVRDKIDKHPGDRRLNRAPYRHRQKPKSESQKFINTRFISGCVHDLWWACSDELHEWCWYIIHFMTTYWITITHQIHQMTMQNEQQISMPMYTELETRFPSKSGHQLKANIHLIFGQQSLGTKWATKSESVASSRVNNEVNNHVWDILNTESVIVIDRC